MKSQYEKTKQINKTKTNGMYEQYNDVKDERLNFHYIHLLSPSLRDTFGKGSPGVRGGKSKDSVQNEKQGGEMATERVSVFLFQTFDVLGDGREENRGGSGQEEKDGAVGQVCVEKLRWFHFLPAWGFSPSKLALAIESH